MFLSACSVEEEINTATLSLVMSLWVFNYRNCSTLLTGT